MGLATSSHQLLAPPELMYLVSLSPWSFPSLYHGYVYCIHFQYANMEWEGLRDFISYSDVQLDIRKTWDGGPICQIIIIHTEPQVY